MSTDLEVLRQEAMSCQRCSLAKGRLNVVWGEGPADARLMIIGEAPGADEDRQGHPFCGRAGHTLDALLDEAGLRRRRAYVTNVVKCRPTRSVAGKLKDRPPAAGEVRACSRYLDAQIAAIKPRVILALGGPAVRSMLGAGARVGVSRLRAHDCGTHKVVATYHPSALNRAPGRRELALADLALAANLLDRNE